VEILSNVLELLSFFLVTPELVGQQRLQAFDKLYNVYRSQFILIFADVSIMRATVHIIRLMRWPIVCCILITLLALAVYFRLVPDAWYEALADKLDYAAKRMKEGAGGDFLPVIDILFLYFLPSIVSLAIIVLIATVGIIGVICMVFVVVISIFERLLGALISARFFEAKVAKVMLAIGCLLFVLSRVLAILHAL
jgi:hypothetical protein